MSELNKIHGIVDISDKEITKRIAVAQATLNLSSDTLSLVLENKVPKGDVFEAAKIAGILAAKATPMTIPHCHPLQLSKVLITFEVNEKRSAIQVRSEVVCIAKTGVEIEAMNAAFVAALTMYDMLKFHEKSMVISDVKLLKKTGGKSGVYNCEC